MPPEEGRAALYDAMVCEVIKMERKSLPILCPVCGRRIPKLTLSPERVAEVYKLLRNKAPEEVAKLARLSLGTVQRIAAGGHPTQKRLVKITPAKVDSYHSVRTIYQGKVDYKSEREEERLHARPLAKFAFDLRVIHNIKQINPWDGAKNLSLSDFGPETVRWAYKAGDTQTVFYFKKEGVFVLPSENSLEWPQLQNRVSIAVSMIRKAERLLYENAGLQAKLGWIFEMPERVGP